MTTPANAQLLDGAQVRDAFLAAAQHLRAAAQSIDAINVYPVPDGDTGTNMATTMRAATEQAMVVGEAPTVTEVLTAMAKGALYGARGNSGVILSQALRGFAQGLGERERLDGEALARGLEEAAAAAYRAVSHPVEGTMLTVLRAAGEAARAAADEGGESAPCAAVLAKAVRAAERAEEQTIEMLPALRDAGVPDAGGEGVCALLRGLLAAITGTTAPLHELPQGPIAMLAGHSEEEYGFCTEFVIEPHRDAIDMARLRELASQPEYRSLVLVGDERAARVHLHTSAPEPLLGAARELGVLSRVKVESMDVQHARFRATGSGGAAHLAVLALSRGHGFDAVFRSLGAAVSDLGEVVKPPAGAIAADADELGTPDVIVLANHKNVVLAARQAAEIARCKLHVVASESLPQGVAACLSFDTGASAAENLAAMDAARHTVKTVEVTVAAADRRAEGISVKRGDAIALLDGRLVAAEPEPGAALAAALRLAGPVDGSLITLYSGHGVTAEQAGPAADAIRASFPGAEVELVEGGQPLYLFIASVE